MANGTPPARNPVRRFTGSFLGRLLLGLLGVLLPLTIVLAVVLTSSASTSLSDDAKARFLTGAGHDAAQIDAWLRERRGDIQVVSALVADDALSGRAVTRQLQDLANVYDTYDGLEIVDPRGRVLARGGGRSSVTAAGSAWLARGLREPSTIAYVPGANGRRHLIATRQIVDRGRLRGLVVGDLDERLLSTFIGDTAKARGLETLIVDSQRRMVARSGDGAGRGALQGDASRVVDTAAVRRALAGRSGAMRDSADGDVLAGYAPLRSLPWAVVTKQPADIALAPVSDQRKVALLILLIGIALSAAFALLFARRMTRPITALAAAARRVAGGALDTQVPATGSGEVRELTDSFNLMVRDLDGLVGKVRAASSEISSSATQLAASAEELSATATEQSSSATETSATMEELARTSASIAESAAAVAQQSAETRTAIAQADEDIQASSGRTLALAERVGEIGAILALINDIADQTNLLALNAAIEAARAGESGAGFAVVADEVRSLAERSKTSAKEIAEIVEGTQAETNATVMAMEKGSRQLRRGVELMDRVAEAAGHVQHTTQQQEAAAAEVVETMEAVSEASRQTSGTIDQVAAAVGNLAALATDLERTAATPQGGAGRPGVDGHGSEDRSEWANGAASAHAPAREPAGAGVNGNGASAVR
jgi:methyl-accepting chemotaxis protein